jgi:hypothetical protein
MKFVLQLYALCLDKFQFYYKNNEYSEDVNKALLEKKMLCCIKNDLIFLVVMISKNFWANRSYGSSILWKHHHVLLHHA